MTLARGAKQLVVQEALEICRKPLVYRIVVLVNHWTYDSVLGIISIEVNTADEHGSIGGRSGDDDLLGTTLQVSGGPEQQCE